MGIFHDVVLGGGDAGAFLQLDNALLLQQEESASLIGGVVGNSDLNGGVLLAAAGEGQGQGQHKGQDQGGELGSLFHDGILLFNIVRFFV